MRGVHVPRSDREIFRTRLEITPEDIDANGHVNNVVYLRWIQDVATAHWSARVSETERKPWSWVALRHEIDYRRALKLGDGVEVCTWVGDVEGARFARFVLIEGPSGPAAQSRTDWCLVDAATMKPARVPPALVQPFVL